jgi:hypothetical protein
MLMYAYNTNTWEMEAGGLQIQGHLGYVPR